MGSWCINPGFKHIGSYAEAHALWLKAEGYTQRHAKRLKALVESDPNHEEPHALDGRKKHFGLRLLSLEDKRPLYSRASMGDHAEKYDGFSLRHYAFRYHRTDCVVYREDDAIFLSSGRYGTVSTNLFVSRLTPRNVSIHFASDNAVSSTHPWSRNLLILDDPTAKHNYWHSEIEGRRVYQLRTHDVALTRLPDGSYTPMCPKASIEPWEKLSIDETLARAVLRSTRYHEFLCWAFAYASMQKIKYDLERNENLARRPGAADDGWPDARRWREMLDRGPVGHAHGGHGETGWECILALRTFHPTYPDRNYGNYDRFEAMRKRDPDYLHRLHVNRLGRAIRLALYQDSPDIIQAQSLPFVGSLSEVASCLASVARWQD